MRKLLVIVFASVLTLSSAYCQADDSKKEYYQLVDSVLEIAGTNSDAALKITDEMFEKYSLNSDICFLRGLIYVYMGDYPLASIQFENGCNLWKKEDFFRIGAFYKALTTLYSTMDMPAKALQVVNKGIKLDKNYSILYMQRGDLYASAGYTKKAIANYKKACNDDDLYCDAKSKIAMLYAETGNIQAGKNAIEESLKHNKYHGESRKINALFALSENNIEGFIDDYMMYMQIQMPTSIDYLFDISKEKQYYDYEMNYAKSILESKEDSIEKAYWEYIIGMIESSVNNNDEMWVHAQNAKALNPGNEMLAHQIEYLYATHYNINDDYANVLISLDTLLSHVTENNMNETCYLYIKKGEVLSRMGKKSEAAIEYEQAVKAGANLEASSLKRSLFYSLSHIYSRDLNEPTKAITYCDSILAFEPNLTSIIYQKGKIYLTMIKDTTKAYEMFKQIIKIEQKNQLVNAGSYTQFALAQMGRFAEAEAFQKQLDELIEKADKTMKGVFYYNAACLYSIIGKSEKAIEKLMSAIDEGIGTCETLTGDEDFDNIRERDEFKAIQKMVCTAEEEEK